VTRADSRVLLVAATTDPLTEHDSEDELPNVDAGYQSARWQVDQLLIRERNWNRTCEGLVMSNSERSAKINLKVLVVLILVTLAIGVSLVVARQVRRNATQDEALRAGQAAYEKEDWPEAVTNFKVYLDLRPDDVEILKKYAEACLRIRPLEIKYITGAVSAYRRVLKLSPGDEAVYKELAELYAYIGHWEELASVSRARLEHVPDDLRAPLWLAQGLNGSNKVAEAQQVLQSFIQRLEAVSDKHVEYVQACVRLSWLAGERESTPPDALKDGNAPVESSTGTDSEQSFPSKTPLEWLNQAVAYAPDSAEALVHRARFYRLKATDPNLTEAEKRSLVAVAREDLEAADAAGTENPRIRHLLAVEWMAHGELTRATAELAATDNLSREAIEEEFFDVDDWIVRRFIVASEIARRQGLTEEAATLADEALKSLTDRRYRVQVLPLSIPLYAVAGRVSDANDCLGEYLDAVHAGAIEVDVRRLAWLQALVAAIKNRPEAVIEVLESVVGSDATDAGLWRLLGEAYTKTNQVGRAVTALVQCQRFNPDDPAVLAQLARLYARMGNWQKSFEYASRAESLGVTDIGQRLVRIGARAMVLVRERSSANEEELTSLMAELAALRDANPDRVDIRVLRAIIAGSVDQPEEAEKELKRAVEECAEPLKAEMQLAAFYRRTERTPKAIEVCRAACKRHPDVAEPFVSLADLHRANADPNAARGCLRQGLDTLADTKEKRIVSIKLALLELVDGDRNAGIDILKTLSAQDGTEIQARLLLLSLREIRDNPVETERIVSELRQTEGESGRWWRLYQASLWLASNEWRSKQQEAVKLLVYCIDADPTWSSPRLLLGGMYEKLQELRKAEEVYRKGLAQNPAATDLADRLLSLLERQERYSDADQVLRQMQINPRVASDWRIRIWQGAGEFMRAIDELKLRVANDDQDASSRIQLARLLYQQTKDTKEAFRYLEEAQAIAPGSRTLVATRALILREEGRADEALQVINQYVADQNDFNAYWMRAVYFAEGGEPQRGEEDYRRLTAFADNGAAAHELLANFYARAERLDQAVAAAEKGVNAYPDSLNLKRTLMRLLFQRAQAQDEARALEILGELEKQVGEDTDPELMTSRVLQMVKDPNFNAPEVAREKLKKVIEIQPRNVTAYLLLFDIEMQEGQYKAACDVAIEALEFNENNRALLLARARAELALGYGPMAFRLADDVLRQDPNNAAALVMLVNAALSSRDTSLQNQARSRIDRAVQRDPSDERLLISRAHILTELKETRMAIPELDAYCRTEAGSASIPALVTLADLYRLADDFERAEQWIDQAEKVDAGNQTVVHARFMWYVEQERYEQLKGMSSKYIAAERQNPGLVMRAAEILISLDPADLKREGVELFKHAAAITNNSRAARLGWATGLQQMGDVVEAKRVYQELLKQYPNDPQVLNNLAWILQDHDQDYEEALRLAERGLRFASRDPYLLDTKGTILEKMGSFAKALEVFKYLKGVCEDALRQAPSDSLAYAETQRRLERVLQKLADLSKAKEQSENASSTGRQVDRPVPSEQSKVESVA